MKEKVKRILCELQGGEGSLECKKCPDYLEKICDRYTNKVIIAVKKEEV